MIEFVPIASSSKGNSYRISDGETSIFWEAGVPMKRIRQAVGFQVTSTVGCLISHGHMDHCGKMKEFLKASVDCYCSLETAEKMQCADHHRVHVVQALDRFNIGKWHVVAFDTVHDCPGSLGFLIKNGDDKALLVTDTAYIPHRFQGLTLIAIECNYNEDVLAANVESGAVSVSQKKRLLFSHFGLENVLEFLRVTDRSRLREVWLLHASNGNSDVARMKAAVQGLTGCPVYVADE